jgi:hypothetical protein
MGRRVMFRLLLAMGCYEPRLVVIDGGFALPISASKATFSFKNLIRLGISSAQNYKIAQTLPRLESVCDLLRLSYSC